MLENSLPGYVFIFQAAVYMGIIKNATRYEEMLKKNPWK